MNRLAQIIIAGTIVMRVAVGGFFILFGLWFLASALMRCGNIDCTDELSVQATVGTSLLGLVFVLAGVLVILRGRKRRRTRTRVEND